MNNYSVPLGTYCVFIRLLNRVYNQYSAITNDPLSDKPLIWVDSGLLTCVFLATMNKKKINKQNYNT